VVWLANRGREATPLIRDLCALDGRITGRTPVLDHCNGDFCSEEGYTPQETPLPPGEALAFAPSGGRACDSAFPYYRLRFEDGGVTMAIGWPGQWAAGFQGTTGGVQVRVGQEKTHLRLMPGERIRTPRITLLAWSGEVSRGVNLWRRWYLAHILPRPNGQPLQPLLACCCPDDGEEFTAATEENQRRYIDLFKQRGLRYDVWWIDAGWYPCYNADHERKWWITGTWEPDPERFPNGLKPVSDAVAAENADLLIWFEPERVKPGTVLDAEHPEWLMKAPGTDNRLLYLGDPACRQWLTDHVCRLIQDNGIKIYRQDHNFPPLAHWRQNEPEDRQGMNENQHVQGYLRFWDDLLARNPGLWIDSCASGGRRNDLETMRRSVPLHYTDYGYGHHPVKLGFHHTLYAWIPYFKEVTLSWDIHGVERFDRHIDRYAYHCAMAPMLFAALDIRRDDYD
jgi:alpha-galactosidase